MRRFATPSFAALIEIAVLAPLSGVRSSCIFWSTFGCVRQRLVDPGRSDPVACRSA